MKLILSTLTAPQTVALTKKTDNGSLIMVKTIEIKGGANVIDRKTLATPEGVVTELSDGDFELLKNTEFYQRMVERGHLRPVETRSAAEDTKKAGMKKRDKSAQKTDADFEKDSRPIVGKGGDNAK